MAAPLTEFEKHIVPIVGCTFIVVFSVALFCLRRRIESHKPIPFTLAWMEALEQKRLPMLFSFLDADKSFEGDAVHDKVRELSVVIRR